MVSEYLVGVRTADRHTSVPVEAEDALIAALKVKQKHPAASITYVRKQNKRGDLRHPHDGTRSQERKAAKPKARPRT